MNLTTCSSKQKIKTMDFLHSFENARCSEFVKMIVDSAFLFDIFGWMIPLVAMFTGGGPLPQIAGVTSYCTSLIKKLTLDRSIQPKFLYFFEPINLNPVLFIY